MSEWKKYKIIELDIDIIDGDRGINYPKQEDYYENEYCLFLNTGNVTREGFDFSNCYYISKQKDQLLRKGRLIRNDIVLTTRGTVGNSAYYTQRIPFENVRINSGMIILRSKNRNITSSFLYQLLKSSFSRNQFEMFTSGTAQPQLPIKDFKKITYLVPLVPEQNQISFILSTYDEFIENNNRRITILEQMAEQLYKEWFVRMRFPEYEDAELEKGVPKGWKWKKVEEVFKTSSGGTPSRQKEQEYYDGEIEWIKTGELKDTFILDSEEKITESGLKNSSAKLFPANTLLMAMYGVNIGQLGISVKPSTANQAVCVFIPKNAEEFSLYYSFYFFKSIRSHLFNISMGAAQQNLSQDIIKRLNYLQPNKEILANFNILQQPIFNLMLQLQQQNQNLQHTRDLLLPRLISGKLRVAEEEGSTIDS